MLLSKIVQITSLMLFKSVPQPSHLFIPSTYLVFFGGSGGGSGGGRGRGVGGYDTV